ncbi:MAG: aminotransferase class I/II-fold pyridoxal phosphate-dependent enzyme [archaeon]|nr:aminotransferase class I/II-fold pyridoxal phosphate-dependent enzyme [archaeon]
MYPQFTNDYSEIGHEKILSAILKYSSEQNPGYGLDKHTMNAKEKIKEVFKLDSNADIHFVPAGTQTNMSIISYFLRPYEAVLTIDTGHINVHETGAIEASGHKVYTCKNTNGKILPKDIEEAMAYHVDFHMVRIKMVYITNSTETGTIYSKKELMELRTACDKFNLFLFIDGARLGSALTSKGNDVERDFLGKIADVFYIGGTKNGLLFGEAVVIRNKSLSEYFRFHLKSRGALLAKGFLMGIQFEELFTNDLYFELAKNSNEMAEYIKEELTKIKIKFVGESCTNQLFIQVPKEKGKLLCDNFGLTLWANLGEEYVLRIVTSFKTKKEDCDQLINFIKNMSTL